MVIKWFSSASGDLDCEEVDWEVFDVALLASVGLKSLDLYFAFLLEFELLSYCQCYVPQYYIGNIICCQLFFTNFADVIYGFKYCTLHTDVL